MSLKKNDMIEVEVTDLNSKGQGVARYQGLVVFIARALPGERIRAKCIGVKRKYALAIIDKIIRESPARQALSCHPRCGGCQLQHLAYQDQLKYKARQIENALRSIGGLDFEFDISVLGMDQARRYRNKVQYPVRKSKKTGQLALGFFAPRSHDLVESIDCQLPRQTIIDIGPSIRQALIRGNFSPYDEVRHRGLIRHVVIRHSAKEDRLHICLVINSKEVPKALRKSMEDLYKSHDKVSGISINHNTQKGNLIMTEDTRPLVGNYYLIDNIGDISYRISPNSFFQINYIQTRVLYEKALDFADLSGNEIVFDLYSGIGTISLFLAKRARWVYGIEIVGEAVRDAEENAIINNIKNVSFIRGAVEDSLSKLVAMDIRPDLVVVDPPRKGLDEKVIRQIRGLGPKKIVYISCNPTTMARDIGLLLGLGEEKEITPNKYRLKSVQGVDMFAMGLAIESVVLLEAL